jgi:hypothetical protein
MPGNGARRPKGGSPQRRVHAARFRRRFFPVSSILVSILIALSELFEQAIRLDRLQRAIEVVREKILQW